jgi:hypothetical protein
MTTAVFDAATELRAPGVAITATTSGTGIAIAPRFLPTVDWVIYASGVLGTGTYTFTLEVSDLVGGTYTPIATYAWPAARASGRVHIPITGDQAAMADTDCAFIRVTATLGATSSIVFGSFLTKSATRAGWIYKQRDVVVLT